MKYMRQLGIILGISVAAEALRFFLPLSVPAGIYGLLLMLLALCSGAVKLDSVKDAGGFLIEIMPLMFIPAAAGLIDTFPVVRDILFPLAAISLLSTVIVMGVTGLVTQFVIKAEARRRK